MECILITDYSMGMSSFWSGSSRHSTTAGGKGDSASSPARDRSKSTVTIADELDSLYLSIRGSPYANSLNEAKMAFRANNYAETLRLVRGASEIYRRSHLQTLQQDPDQIAGGKKEIQHFREKQAKIQGVIEGFDGLLERLGRMAKLKPEIPVAPASARGHLPVKSPSASGLGDEVPPGDTGEAVKQKAATLVSTIDMGSLTQLQTAVQQTGLVSNADAIGFVREHEFREGKYHEAFDRIEVIFQQMRAAAEQRVQRLRREDLDHKSGALKMSPKDWALKVQRDMAQTQVIDRALRYFLRILDALRIMVASSKDH